MAEFEAKVYRLTIEEHPNADALELARVGDYRSIVRKGQFKTGDLGVYIPTNAVVPEWLIQELGLEGKLAGSKKNRVKEIKLRGILSEGLIYPVHRKLVQFADGKRETDAILVSPESQGWKQVFEGDDVTELLGLVKYEAPVPVHMAGEVFNAHGKTLKYDVENIKKFPNVFEEGEEIVITEKIHGTFLCVGYHPDVGKIVTSKGLSAKGLAFKFNEKNESNLYMRALRSTVDEEGKDIIDRLVGIYRDSPVYLLGEVYGKGVQDLSYGAQDPQVRFFDLLVGEPNQQNRYHDPKVFKDAVKIYGGMELVPTLYKGPFEQQVVEELTSGTESVSGKNFNIREGIVIRPMKERYDDELGRVILKSVSEDYLLRKGATEYN